MDCNDRVGDGTPELDPARPSCCGSFSAGKPVSALKTRHKQASASPIPSEDEISTLSPFARLLTKTPFKVLCDGGENEPGDVGGDVVEVAAATLPVSGSSGNNPNGTFEQYFGVTPLATLAFAQAFAAATCISFSSRMSLSSPQNLFRPKLK